MEKKHSSPTLGAMVGAGSFFILSRPAASMSYSFGSKEDHGGDTALSGGLTGLAIGTFIYFGSLEKIEIDGNVMKYEVLRQAINKKNM